MSKPLKETIRSLGRSLKIFLNTSHFPTLVLTVVVTLAVVLFANITPASLPERRALPSLPGLAEKALKDDSLAALAGADFPAGYTEINGTLQPGDTLGNALRRRQVSEQIRSQIINALDGHLDFRNLRPSDRYAVILDEAGELAAYRYESGPLDIYQVIRTPDNEFQTEKLAVPLEQRVVELAGRVESSLFAAFQPHGEEAKLIYTFADIFAARIDFNTETRNGDKFGLIFEKYYKDGEFVGYGRILSAKYQRRDGEVLEAFFYESEKTPGSYFDRQGHELGASFIRSPVPMGRVTSGFSPNRLHPVLNVVRPHLAVDLAAPVGTPVIAAADGRVVLAGWNGGYGNQVILEHANGYRTQYGHFSRIRPGLKVGDRVRQKEVIGYVGATGLATGPHVCYRVQHNGRFVDPLGLKFRPRSVLAGAELAGFQGQAEAVSKMAQGGGVGRVVQVKNITVTPDRKIFLL